MMADRPGKKMGEYAVKKVIAEAMQNEAPDSLARAAITDRAAKAGREAEAEVKREMRGRTMAKGGMASYRKVADGCAQRGKTRGRMV